MGKLAPYSTWFGCPLRAVRPAPGVYIHSVVALDQTPAGSTTQKHRFPKPVWPAPGPCCRSVAPGRRPGLGSARAGGAPLGVYCPGAPSLGEGGGVLGRAADGNKLVGRHLLGSAELALAKCPLPRSVPALRRPSCLSRPKKTSQKVPRPPLATPAEAGCSQNRPLRCSPPPPCSELIDGAL